MDHSYMLDLTTPTEPTIEQLGEQMSTVLDLSSKGLKKVPKLDGVQHIKEIILDENLLQKIDNIDSFLKIEKISISKNNLMRMYGLSRLHLLQEMNLSNNGIITIEGLKDLIHLRHLNLQGNNIKSIEHLNSNVQLEHLNLSENSIGSISDISVLKNLKELYLHSNRLTHLRQCDRYLPVSIQTLTLDHNNISDLNEICTLSGLTSLNSISIQENPCVQMTNSVFIYKNIGFDYRPFVLNWCMTVKVIDGFAVNPIESLKAEWLYSQGRGRQFRIGEQIELGKYLSSVCPLTGEALENEEDRKLRLILSKAQQHQRQLKEEISDSSANNSPATNRRRGTSNRIQSPRVSRLGRASSGSPDSMSSSYHGNTSSSTNNDTNTLIQMSSSLIENVNSSNNIMVQSLDPTILSSPPLKLSSESTSVRSVVPLLNDYQARQCPLVATSKIVPVPETLMSPDCPPVNVVHQNAVHSTPAPPKIESSLPNQKVSSIKSAKESKLMSPKCRSTLTKKPEKSPVLNVRKNNSINTALKANHSINQSSDSHGQKKTLAHKTQSPPPPNQQTSSYTVTPDNMSAMSSDDDSDHFNADKLKTIRNKAAQRSQEHSQSKDNVDASSSKKKLVNQNSTEESAIVIQKIWRGYNTRKTNKHIAETLHKNRTQQHIEKLSQDMETTKVALENERKIQQLQMQAINALWKKVSTLQPPTVGVSAMESLATATSMTGSEPNSTAVVQDLAKTCTVLTNQVQQLQGSMRDIIQCMSVLCKVPNNQNDMNTSTDKRPDVKDSSGTQTEIVAVHTPQVENLPFPFSSKVARPSTLSLTESNGAAASIRKIPERETDDSREGEPKVTTADSSTDNKDETSEISMKSDDDAKQPKDTSIE